MVGGIPMSQATDASTAQCNIPVEPLSFRLWKKISNVKKQLLNAVSLKLSNLKSKIIFDFVSVHTNHAHFKQCASAIFPRAAEVVQCQVFT